MLKRFLFLLPLLLIIPSELFSQYAGRYPLGEVWIPEDDADSTLCCKERTYTSYSDRWSVYYNSKGKGGYKNEQGILVIPCIFSEARPFNKENTAWVRNASDKKYYLINRKGEFVSSGYDWYSSWFGFDNYYSYVCHLVGRREKRKINKGIIDNSDRIVVPLKYKSVEPSFSVCYELFSCKQFDGYELLYNLNGKQITPVGSIESYTAFDFDRNKNGIFIKKINNENYLLNVEDVPHKINQEYKFEELYKTKYVIVHIVANDDLKLYGALDIKGEQCLPCEYDNITSVKKLLDQRR